MNWLIRLVLSGFSLIIADWLLASISLRGFGTALIAAFILGLVNMIVRPILVFFTLPLTIVSLGLFLLVINALTYWFTSMLVPGFEITGFWGAFFGAIVTTIVSSMLNALITERK
ncbi:phage holin family protein [Ammoniphilus sp. CFH 90114]|uniref:phage holin family protein n=1 Tax=Ammoniphilus sp. CFH 90114 TaxID=2493665 RepID=UPI00100E8A69|nr:phage holin family protein [Ammoniphilus sp. CFH 90114]RXT05245.1 phage holin family protein [Ammoniphilus sp. CFH 90114]